MQHLAPKLKEVLVVARLSKARILFFLLSARFQSNVVRPVSVVSFKFDITQSLWLAWILKDTTHSILLYQLPR